MSVNNRKSLMLVAGVLCVMGVSSSSWAQYTWNMTTATPSSGSITDVTAGAVTRGNNNGTTNTLFNATSASNNAGASAGNNAGLAVFSGAFSGATSSYFEFTLTPNAGFAVQFTGITFGSRSTGTGPQTLSVRTSADAFAADAGAATVANNSVWVGVAPTISAPVIGAFDTPLTIRIYGSGVVGVPAINTTTWRIDDMTVNATAVSAAIPEPTTLALLSVGAVGIIARRRKK
jgi:hypothetical protein